MADETLENRVSTLEQTVQERVTIHDLEALQATLSGQILRLGARMHEEFSAVRDEIRAGDAGTRRSLRQEILTGNEETRRSLREEIRTSNEETQRVLRGEIRAGDEETRRSLREEIGGSEERTQGLVEQRTADILASVAASSAQTLGSLRDEIRAGNKETRRYTKVLFEDAIDRIRKAQG